MLSVFQIFKVVLGIIIFIFVMTFFLQITDIYGNIGEKGEELELVQVLDTTLMRTYTSGNPGTFQGFQGLDFVVYETPKLKYPSNQKTLSVNTFLIPSEDEMDVERTCDDYNWFRFCWVYAYPKSLSIIFNPMKNDAESRVLIESIVLLLPDDVDFAVCNRTDVMMGDKEKFLRFVRGENTDSEKNMEGKIYERCDVPIPDYFRLVTIADDDTVAPLRNDILLVPSNPSNGYYSELIGGFEETKSEPLTGSYEDVKDIYFLLTSGKAALDFRNEQFGKELEIAARLMNERVTLITQKMEDLNIQSCNQCGTPFPMACGYVDFEHGDFTYKEPYNYYDNPYMNFQESLEDIMDDISSGTSMPDMEDSASAFEVLKQEGCEQ
ncbi:MAG: hypothetical protein JW789_01075 [Candidatus Aenigmarchaeota archaeon]|nr:hypothetical protein [Candidatus Aenigmarchaeota archaeon]